MIVEARPTVARGSAGDGWKAALDTTAAGSAFAGTDNPQRLADGLVNLDLNRFAVLRAFLRDESAAPPATGNAAGAQATIDVYGWQNSSRRAILLARLLLTAGAGQGVAPLHAAAGGIPAIQADINEVDTATYVTGMVAPDVRSYADGSCLIYLDACECSQIFVRVHAIDASMRLLLLAKGAADIPARIESGFAFQMTGGAATLTDELLDDMAGTNNAAAGSGQQYVLESGEIINAHATTALNITLHTDTSAGGKLWGPQTIPPYTAIPIDFAGQAAGDNKQLRVTSSGNWTGGVVVRGVKRSV